MDFQVGDLVSLKSNGKVGFVIEATKANYFSLKSSQHSASLIENSPSIYFVYFPNTNMKIPTFAFEISRLVGVDGN